MSFFAITKTNTDNSSVRLHPSRSFSSSSSGITGSVRLIAQSSDFLKDVTDFSPFVDSPVDAASVESFRESVFSYTGSEDRQADFSEYLTKVNQASTASRQSKYLEVLRFTQTNTFTGDSLRKNVYRKNLLPFYKTEFPDTGFSFTNYQCMNFVSSSGFPDASSVIYPEPTGDEYAVESGFVISCNVKLNRGAGFDSSGNSHEYPAGTVLFRSSSYALSFVTGSAKKPDGSPAAFRALLQLSSAVDTPPSTLDLNSLPDYTFISSDNSIRFNHWHNVAVTWGKDNNAGTGSFYIDGGLDNNFTLSTNKINQDFEVDSGFGVMIGAGFEGPNNDGAFGANTYAAFFNAGVSEEGVYNQGGPAAGYDVDNASLRNRYNGEVSDVRIYSAPQPTSIIVSGSTNGLTSLPNDLLFYVPCLFIKESPVRKSLLTPFQQETTGTIEPYNVKFSFGVAGRDINLQNYLREFVKKTNPRLYFLTASTIDTTTDTYSADEFLLDVGDNALMHRAREMFILPSDNGKFVPGWNLLTSGTRQEYPGETSPEYFFTDDNGRRNLSIVNVSRMISPASIFEGLVQVNPDFTDNTDKNGLVQQINGASPEDVSVDPGTGYTVLQRTRDVSSNLTTFFDASNMFYGKQIKPGSYSLLSTELSGTSGSISMKARDNLSAGLYRADADSKHATFSRIGDVLYSEGISCITHPCIPFYGKNNFTVNMQGEQDIHVYEVNVPALAGTLNSSSNPNFVDGAKDDYASNYEGSAIAISSILLHDENFNVIARSNLAQPILKTEFDKYMFRVKFDY